MTITIWYICKKVKKYNFYMPAGSKTNLGLLSNLFKFTFYKLALLSKGLVFTVGVSQWRMYWIYSTSNFENSVRKGNLSQVVVINNELPNPIQPNIETLSRYEIKCTCTFILSVVS